MIDFSLEKEKSLKRGGDRPSSISKNAYWGPEGGCKSYNYK